jgi:hypothetical protein
LRVRPLLLLPFLVSVFVVFLELEVIEVKSLCLRSLLDVLDCATSLVLVVFLPKELWMLIPQADVVRVRVVLEELWQLL